MFNDLRLCWAYVRSDFARYGRKPTVRNIVGALLSGWNHSFSYCVWLRLSARPNVLSPLARRMHARLSRRYAIQIYPTTKIGFGLCLGHGVGIIVNPTAVIGNNCTLCHFTTIGSNRGRAATIGNNVYIGPATSIVEDVSIGDEATIGAGSIVAEDIPPKATATGNPAKVVSFNKPGRFVRNRCEELMSLPSVKHDLYDGEEISYIDKFIY